MAQTKARIATLFCILFILLVGGTLIYHSLENWSLVDSFYFTATTLTTIGYGDLVPTSDFSKLVTVAFALSGVASFLYALGVLASHYFEKGQQFEEYEARKIKEIVSNIEMPFKKKKGKKK